MMLNSPAGLTTPAAKGEPLTALNEPSLPTENTEILLDPWLATNRNLPLESAVMKLGLAPTAKGEPLRAVKAPEPASMLKAETLPEPWLAT